MAKRRNKHSLYHAYVIQEQDPAIEQIYNLFKKSGLSKTRMQDRSGVRAATYTRWFDGTTKSPHHRTINDAAMALGQQYVLHALEETTGLERIERLNAALRKRLAKEAAQARKDKAKVNTPSKRRPKPEIRVTL